ncbi:MAG: TonB-dependent receptor [Kofleriaceae bacterium]|nr:TonB-dependent receptor [Kofleriaceae bacterium]
MFRLRMTSLLVVLVAASFGTARAQPAPSPTETPPTETPLADAPPADAPGDVPPADAPPADAPPADAPPVDVAPATPMGTITGRIIDKSTGEGLPAATIMVKGPAGDQVVASELDGTFKLPLAPGNYTITFSTPEYTDQVRSVTVVADKVIALDTLTLELAQVDAKEETIEVYDTIDTRKDSALLAERRFATTVSDAIGAEQIARSPDSNASDAAKRMVGATVQDNRYIVVRGLGGRYSLTLLNGVPLPSPDPDVPAAPLDLFPAALVANLTVNKTFSPDLPASFAGGALGIETRTYPTRFSFKAKVGLGNNTLSSFRELNTQNGGSLDLLGFDDGGRALPSAIPEDKLAGDPSLSQEQANAQVGAFENNWKTKRGTVGPNMSVSAQLGNTIKPAPGQRLGYFATFSYGHSYTHRKAHVSLVGEPDGNGGYLPALMQLDDQATIEQATLGGVGMAGWTPKKGQNVHLVGLYAHTGDTLASQVTGTENNASIVERTRLQFLQRELVFGQLLGEHKLAPHAILEWQGNVAKVSQAEPDTRDLLRTRLDDGRYAIVNGAGASERLFGDLGDTTVGAGVSLRLPYEKVKLKVGASIQRSDRDYQQRRFRFFLMGDSVFQDPSQAFDPSNAGLSMNMLEATIPSDGYAATRTIAGAYAMADVNVTKKLRAIAGARFEASNLDIGIASKIDLMTAPEPPTEQDDRNLLPSLNIVYAVTDSSNLRAAYGMTVARANFRELAPSLYFDYIRRRTIGGNPNLQQTTIHNGDLRWETFLGESEVLAASVFAKHFDQPIERTVETAGDGQNVGFFNSDSARVYGVELEARLSLGRLTPALREFSIGGNLSLIRSEIKDNMNQRRSLQGQSPYVANLGLGYESRKLKTRVDVLYNSFGRRIDEVGTAGDGNIYDETVHRLDLAITQPLPRNTRLKLAGANLLNSDVVQTQNGVEIYAYPLGVTVLGSVEMTLE